MLPAILILSNGAEILWINLKLNLNVFASCVPYTINSRKFSFTLKGLRTFSNTENSCYITMIVSNITISDQNKSQWTVINKTISLLNPQAWEGKMTKHIRYPGVMADEIKKGCPFVCDNGDRNNIIFTMYVRKTMCFISTFPNYTQYQIWTRKTILCALRLRQIGRVPQNRWQAYQN